MGERRTSRKYFETLLKGSVLKCLVPTTGFWSLNAFWAWQVGRVIRSAMAFISHFCLERSPQETFWKGEVKQTHKQEVNGENVCLASGRKGLFISSWVSWYQCKAARLCFIVSHFLFSLLTRENGCFPFDKDEGEKKSSSQVQYR